MLEDLQTTLSEVSTAQKEKQFALGGLNVDALYEAGDTEERLARSLVDQYHARAAMIEEHLPASAEPLSLRDLIQSVDEPERSALLLMLRRVQKEAARIQQEVAVNWLTTWRMNEYVGEMISIIAHAGQPAVEDPHFGLMLDSTA